MLTKHFTVSFGGETEYDICQDGRRIARVEIRYWGNRNTAWNTGVWESDILTTIGTVRYRDNYRQFPTAEIMALFPGYVGACYSFDPFEVHYDGDRPELVQHPTVPEYVTFPAFVSDMLARS